MHSFLFVPFVSFSVELHCRRGWQIFKATNFPLCICLAAGLQILLSELEIAERSDLEGRWEDLQRSASHMDVSVLHRADGS